MGADLAKLRAMKPDEQLLTMFQAISKLADPAERTAAAMAVFSKSGTEMLPVLKGGAESVDAPMRRANELGAVMSTKDAVAAEAFGDSLQTMWMRSSRR